MDDINDNFKSEYTPCCSQQTRHSLIQEPVSECYHTVPFYTQLDTAHSILISFFYASF